MFSSFKYFSSHHHQVNDILAPTQQYSQRMSQYHLICLCWTIQLIKRANIKEICINQMRIILSFLNHMCHMAYVFHSIINRWKLRLHWHIWLFFSPVVFLAILLFTNNLSNQVNTVIFPYQIRCSLTSVSPVWYIVVVVSESSQRNTAACSAWRHKDISSYSLCASTFNYKSL